MTLKFGFWRNFGRMCGLLSSEMCFFRVLHHTEYSWSCARMRLRLWLLKVRMVNQFMLTTFSKSVILCRHVVKF